jgi:uncharacterized integral membrane protein (TIGR00698 family)
MPTARTPGLALALAGSAVAVLGHVLVPALSPTLLGIPLGMVVGLALPSAGRLAPAVRPGLRVASRRVLRFGVALLGLQLVLGDIVGLGWPVLLVIVAVVGVGILATLGMARLLGVPAETGLLVACGFSICGAAAVAGVEGVRESRDEDVATVVSLVVVCGSVAMLVVPLLASVLGLGPVAAGAWSGASIHEVGQVVVAGGLIGGAAVQVAVVVKLGRVLLLAPVLAVLSYRTRRTAAAGRPPLVPPFVLAFLALVALRSLVPLPGAVLGLAGLVQAGAFAAAMFALGCGVDPSVLRRTGRPVLLLAGAATVLVTTLGLPAAYLAG